MSRYKIICLLVAGVLAAASAPASAGKHLEQGRTHDFFGEDIDDVCGVAVHHEVDVWINYTITLRHGLPYFHDRVHGWETFTNSGTDQTLKHVFSNNIRDHRVTDNGDGTLTVVTYAVGNDQWFGADGQRIARDPGTTRFAVKVKHNGTVSDPFDDDFLEFLGVLKDSTGLNEAGDFCEIFLGATG